MKELGMFESTIKKNNRYLSRKYIIDEQKFKFY